MEPVAITVSSKFEAVSSTCCSGKPIGEWKGGKSLGSKNHHNVLRATMEGLRSLKEAHQVAQVRGKSVEEIEAEVAQ